MGRDHEPQTIADTVPAPGGDRADASSGTFERDGGRFVLGGELGRGGMGRVVEATDVALGRSVAIKQVLSDRDDVLARFEREVRVTAQLEHPSIVPVHEAGRGEDGKPYYVMRRIAGESLEVRIRGAATARDRLALLPSVVAAVDAAAFAHARRVIHRDIKPSNIMLGRFGETHLIDWGLARRLDEREADGGPASGDDALTRAGDVYGTVAYMAPEQARGEAVDERADVYALGATLYHLLAGRAPFADVTLAERVAGAQVASSRAIAADVPRELIAIVDKAMAPELEVRYRDAGALAGDLHAFLAGQLVAAHHYTVRQRLVRFIRRHRVAVALTVGLLAVGTVLGLIALGNIVRARDEARANEQLARDGEAQALLSRAAALAESDPTGAALLAGTVSPGSPHRMRARDITSAAAAVGIARGFAPHQRNLIGTHVLSTAVLSPDGMQLATGGMPGRITIIDLATGAARVIARPRRSAQLLWSVPSTIVIADGAKLSAVDVASGALRELTAAATHQLWGGPSPGVIRYHDPDRREVREIALDGRAPTTLVTEVTEVTGEGDLVAYYRGGSMWMREGDRTVELRAGPRVSSITMAVSRALGRVAAVMGDRVFEWDLGGAVVHTWPVQSNRLGYARGLFAGTPGGILRLGATVGYLGGDPARPSFVGELAGAFVYADNDGALVLRTQYSKHRLFVGRGVAPLRIVAARHSPFVAATLSNGGLMWWDTRTLMPELVVSDRHVTGNVCWIDEHWLAMHALSQLVVVERATGAVSDQVAQLLVGSAQCLGVLDEKLYLDVEGRVVRFDLRTHRAVEMPDIGKLLVDAPRGVLVYSRRSDVIEHRAGVERVLWTAPGPIERLASAPGWFAVSGPDFIARIGPDGVSRVANVAAQVLGVQADGSVFWSTYPFLTWWDGRDYYPPQLLPTELWRWSGSPTGAGLLLADRSLWFTRPGELVSRAIASSRASWMGASARAARADTNANEGVVHYLATGTSSRRQMLQINDAVVGPAGELVVVASKAVVQWRDPVPLDERQLDTWIASSTNAALDPTTHAVVWPPWPD